MCMCVHQELSYSRCVCTGEHYTFLGESFCVCVYICTHLCTCYYLSVCSWTYCLCMCEYMSLVYVCKVRVPGKVAWREEEGERALPLGSSEGIQGRLWKALLESQETGEGPARRACRLIGWSLTSQRQPSALLYAHTLPRLRLMLILCAAVHMTNSLTRSPHIPIHTNTSTATHSIGAMHYCPGWVAAAWEQTGCLAHSRCPTNIG